MTDICEIYSSCTGTMVKQYNVQYPVCLTPSTVMFEPLNITSETVFFTERFNILSETVFFWEQFD